MEIDKYWGLTSEDNGKWRKNEESYEGIGMGTNGFVLYLSHFLVEEMRVFVLL